MRLRPFLFVCFVCVPAAAFAADIQAVHVGENVSYANPEASYWTKAPAVDVTLMAQPMALPRPATTTTSTVKVQAVHDGKWIAFRMTWQDPEQSNAGHLGEYSDGVAVQFPLKEGTMPPVFMGAKGLPVHIYHWRAQYRQDRLKGKPTMKELYPNMAVDMYPLEFINPGAVGQFQESEKEKFSPGRVSGNPQSYAKTGVDEIYAEGFSTSSVQEGHGSVADARWENGTWVVVISRLLAPEGGSTLTPGGKGWAAFAVWQGGKGEVGSRKCVTMMWTQVVLDAVKAASK